MVTKQFTISELLIKSLREYGEDRVNGYIQSQMIVHGFSLNQPHFLNHDAAHHMYVVSQDCPDASDEEVEEDADDAFSRRAGSGIHGYDENDVSV
jgi:hypothetical protein